MNDLDPTDEETPRGGVNQSVAMHDVFTGTDSGDDGNGGTRGYSTQSSAPESESSHSPGNDSPGADDTEPSAGSVGASSSEHTNGHRRGMSFSSHAASSHGAASSHNLYRWDEISVNFSSQQSSGEGSGSGSDRPPPGKGLFGRIAAIASLPWKKKGGSDGGVPSFDSSDPQHTKTAAITGTNTGTNESPPPPPRFAALRRSREKRDLMEQHEKASDESSESSDGAAGGYFACCRRCPILLAILLLVVVAIITITVVLTVRRPIDRDEIVELEVATTAPSSSPAERLPTVSPSETPMLVACVCSKVSGGEDYECFTHNHLTEDVAQTTNLTICVFPNEDADLDGYVLGDTLDDFTMELISEAGISQMLNQTGIPDIIIGQDTSGKLTLTIPRPITEIFASLGDDFLGELEVCSTVPLVPEQQVARPEGGNLARPEMVEEEESAVQRPDNIQSALFARPVRSFDNSNQSEEGDEEEDGEDIRDRRRSLKGTTSRILNNIKKGMMWSLTSRDLQPQQSAEAAADVCLSIALGDSFVFDGTLSPSIVPQGLQVCHCDASSNCIDRSTLPDPAVSGIDQNSTELRICLSSPGTPLEEIPVLILDLPSGGSMVIGPDMLVISPDGHSAVIAVPLDDIFTDPSQAKVVTLNGVAVVGESEEMFQLVVDLEPESQASSVEELLSLSNVKEVGGCHCENVRPTPQLALKPLPPENPPCPEGLVSFPRVNEITL